MTVAAILVAAPPGINRLFEQVPAAHQEADPVGCGWATTKLMNRSVYALHRRQDKFLSLISKVADDAWSEEPPSGKEDRNDNSCDSDLAWRSHYRRFSIYAIRWARSLPSGPEHPRVPLCRITSEGFSAIRLDVSSREVARRMQPDGGKAPLN